LHSDLGGYTRKPLRIVVEHPEVAMPRRTVVVVAAAAVVVAAVAAVALAGGGGTGLAPEPATGQVPAVDGAVVVLPEAERRPLPAFRGQTLTGDSLDLGSLRGRPLVLNFWASWCGPCRAEQAALELANRRLGERGVRLVGVNIRDDRGAAASYLEEFEVGYPSLFDRPAVLPARLGALGPQAPPHTLVVDAEGRVAARVFGALPGPSPERQAALLTDLVERVTRA
jgi:thiol-disulfide isomerase/thioredoxin